MESVSPRWLPQVSAPFVYVLKGLDDHGIDYENVNVPISQLKPSQGIVDYDKVNDIIYNAENNSYPLKTIWTSDNDEILDGHHHYAAATKMNPEGSMACMRLKTDTKDGARVLNKLMDLYSAQEKQVEPQEQPQPEPQEPAIEEESDKEVKAIEEKPNKVTVTAYREKPIKEKAVSGNFFHLQPKEGFDKYEIDFDNLLDTHGLNLDINTTNPVVDLCNKWCDGGNLEEVSAANKVPIDKLASKIVAEKAKKLGHDGVKYGDIILQAF